MPDQPSIPDHLIRTRAHHIWEREGCPDGRADEHWQMARAELAIELSPGVAMAPNPAAESDTTPYREPVEPLEAVENLGSFPGLTDQEEELQYPRRRRERRRGRG